MCQGREQESKGSGPVLVWVPQPTPSCPATGALGGAASTRGCVWAVQGEGPSPPSGAGFQAHCLSPHSPLIRGEATEATGSRLLAAAHSPCGALIALLRQNSCICRMN